MHPSKQKGTTVRNLIKKVGMKFVKNIIDQSVKILEINYNIVENFQFYILN